MQSLIDSYRKSKHLHHAYILEGVNESIHSQLCQFCQEDLGLSIKGNPDFIFDEKDKFLIDDAKRLRELQLNKTTGEKQILIFSFNFITREAQNALLKVLEEPTEKTHIFIISPSIHIFLPTVLSRVVVISDHFLAVNDQNKDAGDFLKANYAERLNKISKIVKNIKDEKASKVDAIKLVKDIEKIIYKKKDKESLKKLEELEKISSYLYDQGASTKMLLEHLALIV